MKKFGLIGGIGPASTVQYYQLIIDAYRNRLQTDEYSEFMIESINMSEMLRYVFADELDDLTAFLVSKVARLEESGVEVAAFASNTPHIVFDRVQERSNIKLISIVEKTCEEVKNRGLTKVGLFGTKSTMTAGFYQKVALDKKLDLVIPNESEMDYIHGKYFAELVFSHIVPETKEKLIAIVNSMKARSGIEGLILGGTELPLILQQDNFEGFPIFDTTQIHVNSIVDTIIGK